MSQTQGAINKIRTATEILAKSLQLNAEGSSPEFKVAASPQWSLSQLMQSPTAAKSDDSAPNIEVSNITTEDASNTKDITSKSCIMNCLHEGQTTTKMIRCIMCMKSFHFYCVKENPKNKSFFSCPSCRAMPKLMKQMLADIQQLKLEKITQTADADWIARIDALTVENLNLKSSNQELSEKVDILVAEKLALEQERESLNQSLANGHNKNSSNCKNSLLIGSSIIRNVASKDPSRTAVMSKSGAKQKDVIEQLAIQGDKFK